MCNANCSGRICNFRFAKQTKKRGEGEVIGSGDLGLGMLSLTRGPTTSCDVIGL